jgi:hypothetical protein
MPQPFTTSQYDDKTPDQLQHCPECQQFYWQRLGHACGARPVGAFWRGAWIAILLSIPIWIGLGYLAHNAYARTNQVHPVPAPSALLRARAACPIDKPLKCRAALVRAYKGIEWQRKQSLTLARQMVGRLTDWTCIHQGEGAWDSHTGNGYYGGLQMDAQFERTYGRDMLARYHAHADQWPPRQQIIVAQRAYAQGRGYAPWPNTSRACGLR